MTTPDSFPYMHLARRLKVPYRAVLAIVDEFEQHPERLTYWMALGRFTTEADVSNAGLRTEVAHAVFQEYERRKYFELVGVKDATIVSSYG